MCGGYGLMSSFLVPSAEVISAQPFDINMMMSPKDYPYDPVEETEEVTTILKVQ